MQTISSNKMIDISNIIKNEFAFKFVKLFKNVNKCARKDNINTPLNWLLKNDKKVKKYQQYSKYIS